MILGQRDKETEKEIERLEKEEKPKRANQKQRDGKWRSRSASALF